MWAEKMIYLLGITVFLFGSQWFIETMGEHHYEIQKATDIFDISHKYLPDLHDYQWIINIIPLVLVIWIMCVKETKQILVDTMLMLLLVLVIRALTAASTILPKHDKCEVGSKFWNAFQGGGCYDKIFSGHMALVVLMLLNLQSSGHLNTAQFWAVSIAEALSILLTRGHYTVDVVLGFLIAYLVFDGDYTFVQKLIR